MSLAVPGHFMPVDFVLLSFELAILFYKYFSFYLSFELVGLS